MPTATAADPEIVACCAPLGSASLSDAEAEKTARLFKALADPHRVKIINLLATSPDPVCVCEFTGPLGSASRPSATTSRSSCRSGCWTASSAAPGPTTGSTTTPSAAWPPPSTSRSHPMTTRQTEPDALRDQVRARYAAAAARVTGGQDGCGCGLPADCGCDSGCCGGAASADEPGFGAELYAALDRDQLPDTAVLASLGCGNPTAVAELGEGEIVLDLGSGGGIDVLLSARRVGPTGKAYGLDMTEEMLALARTNAAEAGAGNVEFLKGQIEAILPPRPSTWSSPTASSTCRPTSRRPSPRPTGSSSPAAASGSPTWSPRTGSPEARAERGAWVGCIAGALSQGRVRGRAGRGWLRRHLGELHPPGRRRAALGHHQGHPPHRPRRRRWVCHGPSRAAGRGAVRLLLS